MEKKDREANCVMYEKTRLKKKQLKEMKMDISRRNERWQRRLNVCACLFV